MSQSQRQHQEGSAASASSSYSSSSGDNINTGEPRSQERLQMIDTMKAPIIQMGKSAGYEVIENYDLGAGSIHVAWIFKPSGNESLPDMRLGFVCITEFSQVSLNDAIARSMLNLIDKLVLVVPTEAMTKTIKDSIESMPNSSILQLRKYVTVLTPSTLTSKSDIEGSRERRNPQTGEVV
ncbi:MAG: hypothetical protein ACJ72F_01460 [Nitrososphaeraceae archaeon]